MDESINKVINAIIVFTLIVIVLCIGFDIKRDVEIMWYEKAWEADPPTTYIDGIEVEYSTIELNYYFIDYDKESNVLKLHDRTGRRTYIPVVVP